VKSPNENNQENNMNSFVTLAYRAIETYLTKGQTMAPPNPVPNDMTESRAVFVSLHTGDGMLRGCRGTISPTEPNLAQAIINTAIASATDDHQCQLMS
jgi:AMMECR1 domain-containing protein